MTEDPLHCRCGRGGTPPAIPLITWFGGAGRPRRPV